MTPRITLIVLNYNGRAHLAPCFESLVRLKYPSELLELMLVDNASTDDSVAFVASRWPSVRIVAAGQNLGFAAGNNLGAHAAGGDYLIFLNNDMRVDPRFVGALVSAVEGDVVCAGAKILNWDGTLIDYAGGISNFYGHAAQVGYGQAADALGLDERRPTPFACGGAMIVDRGVFLDAGGFDDDYLFFFEDVDLGWRLWVLGYRIVYAPAAVAYHRFHGSLARVPSQRRLVLYKRNALASMIKNYDDENLARALPAALLTLGAGVVEEAGVDVESFSITSRRPLQEPVRLPASTTASLMAVDRLVEDLARLMERRRFVQSRRKRPDSEILPLFRPFYPHEPGADRMTARRVAAGFGVDDLLADVPRRVLVFASDVLPLPGLPTVGSGLRAWGLGQGLASRGHDIVFSMPRRAVEHFDAAVPGAAQQLAWEEARMNEIVKLVGPDAIVMCNWGIASNLTQHPLHRVPLLLDQHGPHLLERQFQGHGDPDINRRAKLAAFAKADYFTCAGKVQLEYFHDLLREAGWTDDDIGERATAVHFSLSPEQPERRPADELTFVYGGVWLPWQDPSVALLALAAQLDERKDGILRLFGGRHPWIDVDTGIFEDLITRLEASPHVVVEGQLSHAELLTQYATAHVAVDVMKRNRERELAFTSRSVEYLWCGLPVIYNDYSELSTLIRDYDAGWVVDAESASAITAVLAEIFSDRDLVLQKSRNARRLVRERLSWDRTIDPLDSAVRAGHFRTAAASSERPAADAGDPSMAERIRWTYRNRGAAAVAQQAARVGLRALRTTQRRLRQPPIR